eukprot:GFYU01040499.1.p1 GENE.GFYU01040499.1~~GFYU01040499.1.p1  ORF type:complete len:107 (-),score=3.08 GFYU01040499.1:106-426(-)
MSISTSPIPTVWAPVTLPVLGARGEDISEVCGGWRPLGSVGGVARSKVNSPTCPSESTKSVSADACAVTSKDKDSLLSPLTKLCCFCSCCDMASHSTAIKFVHVYL